MRVAGLFAGIGGLELGLTQAGHKTGVLCEIWEPAAAVLRSKNPRVKLERDVRTLASLPSDTELITAGFPCQDLSQAGRTAGITGAKSGLVDQVFRLVDGSDAPLVLLENVSFMLKLDRGGAMKWLTREFEARGFRWAYRTVNSLAFLPQRRERVFMLASRGPLEPEDVLFADDAASPPIHTTLETHAHGFYWTEGIRGLGWAQDATPPLKNGSTVGIASPPAILLPDGRVIKPDLRDAERLQGFPADWTLAAEKVGRPSLRWSLIGNAVTVPVAKWIGERLNAPRAYSPLLDASEVSDRDWPRAARFDGKTRYVVHIGDFPLWTPRPALHNFLQHEGTLLSTRATRGFYNRTKIAKLRFPPGFLGKIAAHLRHMEQIETPKAA